jgi:hypothetical protein
MEIYLEDCGLDSVASGQGSVVGSCGHDIEALGFIKDG